MQKHMRKRGVMLIGAVVVTWVGLWGTQAFAAARAPVAEMGQTQCWDAMGNLISCADTGQDGDIRAGVSWPIPRFTARRGVVRDNLTGLVWLQNAYCFADQLTWVEALPTVNVLHDTGTSETTDDCGLADGSVAGDWRLPNLKELQSLLNFGFAFPALSNAAGTGPWVEGDAFVGARNAYYWSSTSFGDAPNQAWIVGLHAGDTTLRPKDFEGVVWAVRGGN